VQAGAATSEDSREREKRRIREDFELAAQRQCTRLNKRIWDPCDSPSSRHQLFWSNIDLDMFSALICSSTRPPLSKPGTTPAPSHLPTPRNTSPSPPPGTADEEPLAGSGVCTAGTELANVDPSMYRRSVVVSASRRSLIEDHEGCQHSVLV
jgi:hypothetical protein